MGIIKLWLGVIKGMLRVKHPLLQQILLFVSVTFHGNHKTVAGVIKGMLRVKHTLLQQILLFVSVTFHGNHKTVAGGKQGHAPCKTPLTPTNPLFLCQSHFMGIIKLWLGVIKGMLRVKHPLLKQILFFVSVSFHGNHKTVKKSR